MNTRQMAGQLGAQVVLLLVAAGLLSFLAPGTSRAGDPAATPNEARLLVKCERNQVSRVLAGLLGLRVRVYDLDSMKELQSPGQPGALPALPDAARALAAFNAAAVESVRPPHTHTPRIRKFVVTSRRLSTEIAVLETSQIDALRVALASQTYFAARTAQIYPGAMSRVGGVWHAKIDIALAEVEPSGSPVLPAVVQISHAQLRKAELSAKMTRIRMGAERNDPDRRVGIRTLSCELTYAAGATIENLTALLKAIHAETNLTVFELRWSRPDPKRAEVLGNVVLRVGMRAPLTR